MQQLFQLFAGEFIRLYQHFPRLFQLGNAQGQPRLAIAGAGLLGLKAVTLGLQPFPLQRQRLLPCLEQGVLLIEPLALLTLVMALLGAGFSGFGGGFQLLHGGVPTGTLLFQSKR